MPRIVNCINCGRERKHYAKGKCHSCYAMRYRQTPEARARHAATEKRRRQKLGDEYRRRERERNKSPKRIAWMKKYQQSKAGRESNRRGSRKDRRVNPERTRARQAIRQEVKTGRMPSPRTLICKHCGKPSREYHHHKGYSEEHKLDVVPLCKVCHVKVG